MVTMVAILSKKNLLLIFTFECVLSDFEQQKKNLPKKIQNGRHGSHLVQKIVFADFHI